MVSECSGWHDKKLSDLSFRDDFQLRAGILLISEIGLVTFVLASSLLVYSLRQVRKKRRESRNRVPGSGVEPQLQPISVLFLCAIFTDTIHGISNTLSIKWAYAGKVTEGSYCTAQGVLRQIGYLGVGWYTIAIAVLTYLQVFHSKWLGTRGARIFVAGSICFITTFTALITAVPAAVIRSYYGSTGLWCSISADHWKARVGTIHASLILAALVTILAYGMVVYKWVRQASFDADRVLRRDAFAMGWYPVVALRQPHNPTLASSALFSSWGALNVILWCFTGRHFGFSQKTSSSDSRPPVDVEMAVRS
ncbi:uncharacterized protein EI90DRAFT_3048911 [Cantharellus anzutake]|uniref:uncharacterized protein n=1 Tax=Cantharellus anzutake TaxID=1750568 RepID=UPI001906ACFD|nr:uncharacterized protein EI90DRAFT_3048911 [Cantharellus anzutake]KAF8334923.1 hypothetical protein EI90DRAFT_3048911 [Cantharellus anzutake]